MERFGTHREFLHRIFAIARIDDQYHTIAVANGPCPYPLTARLVLQRCLGVLRTFGHGQNRIPIEQELRFARGHFNGQPAPQKQNPRKEKYGPSIPFPFISTCLVVGASFESETGRYLMTRMDPVHHGYDDGDLAAAITVLDITDLDSLKYCFVYTTGSRLHLSRPSHKPLSAWDYFLSIYHKTEKTEKDTLVFEAFDEKSLVDDGALASAWPWGEWRATDLPPPTRSAKSIGYMAISQLVNSLASSKDYEDFDTIQEMVRVIPTIQPLLRDPIRDNATPLMGRTPAWISLLVLAYEGQECLDWGSFRGLTLHFLRRAFDDKSLKTVTTLNISGTEAIQDPTFYPNFCYALSPLRQLNTIYMLEPPSNLEHSLSHTILKTLAETPEFTVSKMLLSGPFYAFPYMLPEGFYGQRCCSVRDSSHPELYSPSFPVVQLLVHHKTSAGENEIWPYETFFLGDAQITSARFVTGLLRYIRCLNAWQPWFKFTTGCCLASCMGAGSTTLADTKFGEVNPVPVDTFRFGLQGGQTWGTSGCYAEMRDMLPGQWSVLLTRNVSHTNVAARAEASNNINAGNNVRRRIDMGFRYAFVRAKVLVQAEPQSRRLTFNEVDVFDLGEFLRATRTEGDVGDLQPLYDVLLEQAGHEAGTQVAGEGSLFSFVGVGEAYDLMSQFMNNMTVIQNCKRRVLGWRDGGL